MSFITVFCLAPSFGARLPQAASAAEPARSSCRPKRQIRYFSKDGVEGSRPATRRIASQRWQGLEIDGEPPSAASGSLTFGACVKKLMRERNNILRRANRVASQRDP